MAAPSPSTATASVGLSRADLALLREIHEADRDRGGLLAEELTADEVEVCSRLVGRGLAEVLSEFGESPDGEEDERDAGASYCFRITGQGVAALRLWRDADPTAPA
jgi:hypothetical protein